MSVFQGLSAFPITPIDEGGRVVVDELVRLLGRIEAARADSVCLLGSTGSYMYLGRAEKRRALEAAASCLDGRVALIVGIGALRTDEARELARDAEAAGAAGILLAPVSYTPLTSEEVFQHYVAVAGATSLPLCIYNNPATTHFSFDDALLARLAGVSNIVAAKYPAGAPAEVRTRHEALQSHVPAKFALGYSVDWHAAAAVLAGGRAWYSVVAGLFPAPALALTRAAQAGDRAEVERLDHQFAPLWALFRELSSYRVVHTAAKALGLVRTDPPRPILPLSAAERDRVMATIDKLGWR